MMRFARVRLGSIGLGRSEGWSSLSPLAPYHPPN